MNWYLKVPNKWSFRGRAQRAEYWFFVLFHLIVSIVLVTLDSILGTPAGEGGIGLLFGAYLLAAFVPALAVTARRLHDTGRSGWWLLLLLVPCVNIVLLVWMVQDGSPGVNQYGPNPKGA